jgi:phosphoglycolate phosphatase
MQVMPRNLPVDAVLFDLDGTLLHTSPDIGCALNRALTERGMPPIAPDAAERLIGGGSAVLVERALSMLGLENQPQTHTQVLHRYELAYESICKSADGHLTERCPGLEAALEQLREMGIKLGVVSNKEMRFLEPLLLRFNLSGWFDIVVDGTALPQRKPDPAPLLHACDALAVEPAHTLYVGDSVNDVLAAQAAGMPVVCVSYGYSADHPVSELPCLSVIDDLSELPDLIGGQPQLRKRRAPMSAHPMHGAHRSDDQPGYLM